MKLTVNYSSSDSLKLRLFAPNLMSMSKQVHQLLALFTVEFIFSFDFFFEGASGVLTFADPFGDAGGVAGLLLVLVFGRNLTIKTYDLERQAN